MHSDSSFVSDFGGFIEHGIISNVFWLYVTYLYALFRDIFINYLLWIASVYLLMLNHITFRVSKHAGDTLLILPTEFIDLLLTRLRLLF